MTISPDPVFVKYAERMLKRPLTQNERHGIDPIYLYKDGKKKKVLVPQVSLAYFNLQSPGISNE